MTARRGAFGSRRGYSSSHGVTDSTADYGSAGEGSSPSGSAQGWLAQWESTRSTPAGRRFDSFAGYGERGVEVCMRGRDPRGPGSIPGVHPKGGLFMVRQAARKAAASALGVRISPRPLASMVQRIGRQFPELEVGGSTPPGSAHGTDLAGAGGSLQNCRRPVRLRPVSP